VLELRKRTTFRGKRGEYSSSGGGKKRLSSQGEGTRGRNGAACRDKKKSALFNGRRKRGGRLRGPVSDAQEKRTPREKCSPENEENPGGKKG